MHSEELKASSKSQSVSRIIKVDRQLNVVVYGVPENTTGTSRLSRQQNDLSKAIELIHSLDESIPVQSIRECYRLGKYLQPNRPRPLLVRMSRKFEVKTILSNQSRPYYIKPDMSPEELATERLLLKDGLSFSLEWRRKTSKSIKTLFTSNISFMPQSRILSLSSSMRRHHHLTS